MAVVDMAYSEETLLNEISKYIFTSKYARYLPDLKRRETWEEAVKRVETMHLRKFEALDEYQTAEIQWAFDLVREKRIGPSMRSLQFGGPAVEAHNPRIYNCAVRHVDSIRAFSELFYLLLCGCGTGIGLSPKFLHRFPDLVKPENKTGIVMTYVVEDSIEGWADSLEALLNCYFVNTAYSGRKIVFDYSRIRPAGSPLKTGGGKAPGHEGLKNAHQLIKKLLDHVIEDLGVERLRSIDAYDILMHAADAVLSGGVRRSATSVVFPKEDELMMNAKVGNWHDENPQRARSNNSVLLIRDEMTQEELEAVIVRTREWGEPGFVFADDPDTLYNPCQPEWAPILTRQGIKPMGEIVQGDEIWSETGWTTVVKKWSTGVKDVYRYTTTAGTFYGTENHKLVSNGAKVKAKDAKTVDPLSGPVAYDLQLSQDDVAAGLMIGDGSRNHPSGVQTFLGIGVNDSDYFESEVGSLIGQQVARLLWDFKSDISADELVPLPNRVVPDRYFFGDAAKAAGFLRGLFSANGSVVRDRVTLKTSSPRLREQVQFMLSSLGIRSYFTTNSAKTVNFSNGSYDCVESYDLNVTSDRQRFAETIGFIQSYKNEKLEPHLRPPKYRKSTYEIVSTELVSTEEVFDITVDNDPHTYWTGGLNVSNCFEVSFIPVTDDGVAAVQFCNLTTINGAKVRTADDFMDCARAAAIIGTLQASYTDFPYLSHQAKELTEEEALLGVSITAMFENPDVLLDPELQRAAAEIVKSTNARIAKAIGINPAARATVIKPEGTSTLAFGSMFSGIHGAHARWMLRRVQANKMDNVYRHFKMYNPHMTEASVWSANGTDDIITFPVKVTDSGILKTDLTALEHLEIIRSTQQNWVVPGTGDTNKKNIHHNVSCTVSVSDDEWEKVSKYLFDNRGSFAAVSLLADDGDKKYAQAPNESVSTDEEFFTFRSLVDGLIPVDYTLMIEEEDGTEIMQEMACAGNQCEVR